MTGSGEASSDGGADSSAKLDDHHPIVFRRGFVHVARRIQWLLLAAGALMLAASAVMAVASIEKAGPIAAGGGAALLFGILWTRLWRRHIQRAWWGDKYGKWF